MTDFNLTSLNNASFVYDRRMTDSFLCKNTFLADFRGYLFILLVLTLILTFFENRISPGWRSWLEFARFIMIFAILGLTFTA